MHRRAFTVLGLVLALAAFGLEPARACQVTIRPPGNFTGTWSSSCGSAHRAGRFARYYSRSI
jgi:hypothetical protein